MNAGARPAGDGAGSGDRPTLYLIDGHAQFFRAYHAIRTPMTSPVTGEPTNATFGFVGVLLKILREKKPDYLAVAIDAAGDRGTFRSRIYEAYKAHREEPPESLGPQIERCVGLLRAIGAPVLAAAEVEADDTIATVVRRLEHGRDARATGEGEHGRDARATGEGEHGRDARATGEGEHGRDARATGFGLARLSEPWSHGRDARGTVVRIVSKDKDLMQLLEPGRVEMYDPYKDEVVTAETLRAETGLAPGQVVDMLALVGDPVDNVPGVPGIGPKTAAELIARFGSLDALLERGSEIKGKRGESIRAASETVALSRSLVRLRDDVPIDFDLESARVDRLDLAALEPILRELGFNRHRDDLLKLISARGGETVARASRPGAGAGVEVGDSHGRDARATGDMQHGRDARATGDARATESAEPAPADSLFAMVGAPVLSREPNPEYRTITTREQLLRLIAELRGAAMIAVDTETTGLDPMRCRLVGLCLATKPGAGVYIPVRSPDSASHLDEHTVLDALRPILEDPAIPKTGHNLKYDVNVLRNVGVELRGVAFDTMIASFLIDSSRSSHGMDALALALLGHSCVPIRDLIGSGKHQRTFDTVPIDAATQYAAEDADISLRLYEKMAPQIKAMGFTRLFHDVELPLVEVLAEMEFNGVLVDAAELDRQSARLNARLTELRSDIDAAAPRPFNPDSPKQLAAILFNPPDDPVEPGLGLGSVKKTRTGRSTDVEVLERLAADASVDSPLPGLILEHRQLAKLIGTYLVALKDAINPRTGRVHASFHQTGAATGRLSSSDPNLQNIPIRTEIGREIRRAFRAPAGRMLITADYSQIELRLLAHLSKDEALSRAFHAGEDIHRAVAAEIHGVPLERVTKEQRSGAKMVNFGIVYGVTAFGLARRLGVSNDEAATIIDDYKKRFPGITLFLAECVEHAKRHGYVETALGRRRAVPQVHARNPNERALGERIAINSVVQGSAADLIKIAMVDLHRRLSPSASAWRVSSGQSGAPEIPGVLMLLQIHDELVFEAPADVAEEARRLIAGRMESAMRLDVPLVVDSAVSETWFEGK